MATLAFRISDNDKKFLSDFAKFHGKNLSELAREIILDRIEDEEDRKAIERYESIPKEKRISHSHEEVMKKYGLGNQL
jgi:predicted DNA-binding protein